MAEDKPKKPKKGAWDNLGQAKGLKFEVDKPIIVQFLTDEPEERESTFDDEKDSVYYVFPVKTQDGIETTIETTAWTLLDALHKLIPLKNKKAQIVKKMEKGRQTFSVVELITPQ